MNPTIDVNNLLIRSLPTPNPYALKFVLNAPVKEEGKATFNSPAECNELPLVRDLFAIDGVRQVHLFQNTLSVTHSGELENEDLDAQVSAVIKSRYPVHDSKFGEMAKPVRPRNPNANPQISAIEEILDRTIRPGLQADGGDIEVLDLVGNELIIRYEGACGGCPSSSAGTLDAIQGILRNELPNDELIVTPVLD